MDDSLHPNADKNNTTNSSSNSNNNQQQHVCFPTDHQPGWSLKLDQQVLDKRAVNQQLMSCSYTSGSSFMNG